MDDQARLAVLLAVLARRYDSLEKIRDRADNMTIWTLGIFLGAAGLLVQGAIALSLPARAFLVAAAVFAAAAVFQYLRDLERGFRSQFRVAVRVERQLRLYDPGVYAAGESVYPEEWARSGGEGAAGRFFQRTYLLLGLGAAVLVTAIGLSGVIF